MNIPTILVIAVLSSIAANALHWRGRSGERFSYYPQSGLLRHVFTVWTVTTLLAAILFLARILPLLAFVGVVTGMTVARELYSIARRHQQRVSP